MSASSFSGWSASSYCADQICFQPLLCESSAPSLRFFILNVPKMKLCKKYRGILGSNITKTRERKSQTYGHFTHSVSHSKNVRGLPHDKLCRSNKSRFHWELILFSTSWFREKEENCYKLAFYTLVNLTMSRSKRESWRIQSVFSRIPQSSRIIQPFYAVVRLG